MQNKIHDDQFNGYYIVSRPPQEVRNMIEHAKFHAQNVTKQKTHEAFMRGILWAFNYMADPDAPKPDEYKGIFNMENILKGTRDPEILKHHCATCLHKMRDEKVAKMFKIVNPRIADHDTESPDQ